MIDLSVRELYPVYILPSNLFGAADGHLGRCEYKVTLISDDYVSGPTADTYGKCLIKLNN